MIRLHDDFVLFITKKDLNLLKIVIYTPLEQFQIALLFSIQVLCFDFSITNLVLVNFLVLLLFRAIVFLFSPNVNCLKETSFFFIPSA
jgi:hypothetical protein